MPRCRAAALRRQLIVSLARLLKQEFFHFSLFTIHLQHNGASFVEQSLLTALLFANFLYQMVATQARHLLASRGLTTQIEAANDILDGKLIRQTIKSLVGLLTALHIHAGVLQLVVELVLGHRTKVVTLTGKLDVGYQLSQTPIDLVRLKLTTPVLTVLL